MPETKIIKLIGRRENVDFPELNIFGIEAKIDTGAYTSALHCHDVYVKKTEGKNALYFKLLDPTHPEYNEQEYCFDQFSQKVIKSSSGEVEERYIIKTIVRIGSKKIRCTISLTDRGNMRYPVLIGRKMIKGHFIIDVGKKFTGGILISKRNL